MNHRNAIFAAFIWLRPQAWPAGDGSFVVSAGQHRFGAGPECHLDRHGGAAEQLEQVIVSLRQHLQRVKISDPLYARFSEQVGAGKLSFELMRCLGQSSPSMVK